MGVLLVAVGLTGTLVDSMFLAGMVVEREQDLPAQVHTFPEFELLVEQAERENIWRRLQKSIAELLRVVRTLQMDPFVEAAAAEQQLEVEATRMVVVS